jgi:organic hydroperoxide reductase OsmC/OhrA
MVESTEVYEVKVSWNGESGGDVIFKDHSMKIDTPIKYGGQGKGLCPDELFFASIAGCLTTTFLFFKRKLRLELSGLEISVQGEVESHGSKGYFIGSIQAMMWIEVNSGDEERAQRCSDLAKEYCHITRSIEGSISIEVMSEIISN